MFLQVTHHDPIILLIHIIVGGIALLAGVIALSTLKGSKIHKRSGWVFSFGMFVAIITTLIFMFNNFLPLAILMSLGSFYFILGAITAIRNESKWAGYVDKILILIPLAIVIFLTTQLISILPKITFGILGRLLFLGIFGGCLISDIQILFRRPDNKTHWIRRHLFRMILAFGLAFMALIRIGIKLEIVSLEVTVVVPLILSLFTAYLFDRSYVNRGYKK